VAEWCRVLMQMYRHGHGLVFEVFTWVNMVKWRLQEAPQERSHTESDAYSHSLT